MEKPLLASLKQQHGEIYTLDVGGKEIAFRSLSISEIGRLEEAADDPTDLEDLYVLNAVVFPYDFDIDKIKAGHVSQIAQAIGNVSGSNIDFILETLNNARNEAQENILIKIKAMIIAAMPALNEEYLSDLTMKQLLEKLVLAEEILTITQAVNGIQSATGVRLDLVPAEEQTQTKQSPKVDKEALLRRIKHEEREMSNSALTPIIDPKGLEQLDDEILIKAAGIASSEDPIARKLRQAMGG